MTRLKCFQVAGILVAALLCFSGVGDARVKITTAAADMATAVTDITTVISDVTDIITEVTDMTTEGEMTSSNPSGGTTSAPQPRWKVKDKKGKLCMLMDFDGTITWGDNATEKIPSDASTVKSECNSSFSAFVLEFQPNFYTLWTVVLNFTTSGSSFRLNSLSVDLQSAGNWLSSSETRDFFDVPLGDYYTCSHFEYNLSPIYVYLENPIFQPFVQKTDGGDNLGQPYVCRTSSNTTGIIIGVIITIIVIVAVIAGAYCYVKRLGRPSGPSYTRV